MALAEGGPSPGMLTTGIALFGITWGASAIVAAGSSRDADKHLYVPLAGPWMDLVDRGRCNSSTTSCNTETTNKVLLVGDGVFQTVGALLVVGAFLNPTKVTKTEAKAHVQVVPYTGRSSYGLAAVGSF